MPITKLSLEDYPNMDTADVGKLPNLGYGTVEDVPCHAIVGGATTQLTSDLNATATSFDVDDETRFPTAPFTIQIQEERMRVTATSGATFTVTRGYDNTEAIAHSNSKGVFEVLTLYIYIASKVPIDGFDAIKIDGQKQDVAGDSRITTYTGQSGDEHPSYPGKAIITFAADAYVAPQYNVDEAANKESGTQITATVDVGNYFKLYDDTSETLTIGEGNPTAAWVRFNTAPGSVIKQKYSITVSNTGATTAKGIASVTIDHVASVIKTIEIAAGDSETIVLSLSGGQFNDVLVIAIGSGTLEVSDMAKVTTIRTERYGATDSQYSEQEAVRVIESYDNGTISWATYSTTALGDAVISQEHFANIIVTTAGKFRIAGVGASSNISAGFIDYELSAGTHTIKVNHDGGDWDTMTKVVPFAGGVCSVTEITKTIQYSTAITNSAQQYVASATSRIVVGDTISVDARWSVDETAGSDYGGGLIENPEDVIAHFIVTMLGFNFSTIDTASFTAAAVLYASAITGGYSFGFIWAGENIREFARECRSTLKYSDGSWYLDYIPDTAPASVQTVEYTELAGDNAMFVFDKMPRVQLGNSLTVKYKRDYLTSAHLLIATASDSASITKYGQYPKEYTFNLIRSKAMADHVLAHMLLETKVPLLSVTFALFFENFNLVVGDTITISNNIFNGRKFFIEETKRDKMKVQIKAKEWW